jgi:hypothetical protein
MTTGLGRCRARAEVLNALGLQNDERDIDVIMGVSGGVPLWLAELEELSEDVRHGDRSGARSIRPDGSRHFLRMLPYATIDQGTCFVCYGASPLLMHSVCIQHQVIWCASLAAIDYTVFIVVVTRAGGRVTQVLKAGDEDDTWRTTRDWRGIVSGGRLVVVVIMMTELLFGTREL